MDCIFCEIAAGRMESRKVYEDDAVLAFHDIRPQAPTHVLIVPKRHIESLATVLDEDWPLVTRSLQVVRQLAEELGLARSGYRVVANVGINAGQTVPHLHWHLLGGRGLGWPPG